MFFLFQFITVRASVFLFFMQGILPKNLDLITNLSLNWFIAVFSLIARIPPSVEIDMDKDILFSQFIYSY